MASRTCGLINDGTWTIVKDGQADLEAFASKAILAVEEASDDLDNLISGLTPIDIDFDIRSAGDLSDPFTLGDPPPTEDIFYTKPVIDYNPSIEIPVFDRTVQPPDPFTKPAPEPTYPPTPGELDAEAPGNPPEVGDYVFPPDPDDTIPPLPYLTPIIVPDIPDLQLPTFDAAEPTDDTDTAIGVFDWSETGYVGTVDTELVTQLKDILGGSTGIPDCVWNMIFARARKQIRNTTNQAREEAEDYWASRGHFLSNGQLRQRTKEAADVEREQVSEIVREQTIQDSKIYVERLNTALAQSIAYETQLIGLYNQQMQRSLEAARTTFQIAIDVANLKITRYNIRMQGYLVNAQVFDTVMKGELARLEETRLELEAQKLVSQVNLQELEAYKAQLTAIVSTFDLFKAQVEAVIAKYDADKTRVEAFAESVNVYEAKVSAFEAEWRGYGEAVKAQVALVDGYKAEADAYSSLVAAYSTGVQADKNVFDAKIDGERLKIDRLGKSLDKFSAEIQAETAQSNVELQNNELDLKGYEAHVSAEEARVRSDAQRLDVLVRNLNAQLQAQANETQLKIQEAQNKLSVQTSGLDAIVRAHSSIGSSALAALNYAASIQYSAQNASQCQTQYKYEIAGG